MRIALSISIIMVIFSCGAPTAKNKNIIGSPTKNSSVSTTVAETSNPSLHNNAVQGNFNGNNQPISSYIKKIDAYKGITTIAFENNVLPQFNIPETYGGTLRPIQLEGFDRDLLLVNAILKDKSFSKYYLFVMRNYQWKMVVNGFAIHNSNRPDTLMPIKIDKLNPKNVIRYYSVFDLDKKSELGYTWRLLQESIPIENN